jgi:hypothetical protein
MGAQKIICGPCIHQGTQCPSAAGGQEQVYNYLNQICKVIIVCLFNCFSVEGCDTPLG